MFNFEKSGLQRAVLAALGAFVLSTTAVTAAVGPAMAGGAAPAGFVQTNVADGASA